MSLSLLLLMSVILVVGWRRAVPLFASERLVIGSETGYACGLQEKNVTIMTPKGGVGTWREQPG